MARSRYRITPFARFLVFMLFFAPVAYVGASYYNGEDGLEKIKSLFDKSETTQPAVKIQDTPSYKDNNSSDHLLELKDLEIKALKQRVQRLENKLNAQAKIIEGIER